LRLGDFLNGTLAQAAIRAPKHLRSCNGEGKDALPFEHPKVAIFAALHRLQPSQAQDVENVREMRNVCRIESPSRKATTAPSQTGRPGFELATDLPLRERGGERREAPVDHIERAEELLAMRIGEADETNIGQAELIALAQVHALLAICDLLEARRGELPVQ
jgi:hypothetical protein